MSQFVEFTLTDKRGSKILIHTPSIEAIQEEENGAVIGLASRNSICVRETYQEAIQKIAPNPFRWDPPWEKYGVERPSYEEDLAKGRG